MGELIEAGLLRPKDQLDYYHTAFVDLPVAVTPLEGWNIITGSPNRLLQLAFDIRDGISALFGVEKIVGFSGKQAVDVQVGDRLDFFLVEYSDPEMLVLTARDRHLDVMTTLSVDGVRYRITSSVVTHNWFGRLYMIPVGVAHRWIVAASLRRLTAGLQG